MQGFTLKEEPRRSSPRIPSIATRYIQPAEPVYQVQPAAAAVRRVVVDVSRDRVRLRHVAVDPGRGPRVVHGVEHVEEPHRLVPAAEPREGQDDPEGRVRVLAAVLADARDVALDVARVVGRPVERGSEEEDDTAIRA